MPWISHSRKSWNSRCEWRKNQIINNSTLTVVNTNSTDDLANFLYCKVDLAGYHRAAKCQLVPQQLCIKIIQSHQDNLKALPRQKSSVYMPKYEFCYTSSWNFKLSTPTTKQSTALHNRSSNNKLSIHHHSMHPGETNKKCCLRGSLRRWQ